MYLNNFNYLNFYIFLSIFNNVYMMLKKIIGYIIKIFINYSKLYLEKKHLY